jgi:endonuclease III
MSPAAARGRARRAVHPKPERIREIRDMLRSYYGRPRNEPHHAPLDELVLTVLSQNTNDRNRDVAYERLRDRFADWQAVAHAPDGEIEESIRPGGISKVKARRIKAMLGAIEAERGSLDLGFLADAPREEALEFLERLPGVGRKTAACVLLFSFDRPELPVDTHVYRVASRLGLIRPRASFEEAHDVLLAATDPDDVYELHVNLIRHGRRLCTARAPACGECPLLAVCPYGKRAVGRRR